ncbi:LysR family transcriptional regulator [Enterobacillus tribolii]|uniref:DNA-binding transcriptional LysR family regulator n=1 Tax=Enterobacillus tribolii TaxID=1487935 RepID=A0A370R1C2_9GAMM|nr:LysR family transcriptional regulator [Enterobacillus tribolii]MBW7982711.1 LysR family transcriptional regulator [Enterobacillus tribolii]RDK95727.1 DNA-binding transcriptional LysR family regulator [Enterobacillus tribolii]
MASLDWYIRSQLKLRHLQLLVALDDLRNVGKVATYLHVSQPAVSKALSELENNIGLKLFNRTVHGMQPTIYGGSLVVYAKRILAELGKARDELRALISGVEGKVTVGALPAAAVAVLPKAIAALKTQSPVTAISIIEGSMDTLKPRLREGEIEVIVGLLPEDDPLSDVETLFLYQDNMVLATGSHHPLGQKKHVTWDELRHSPWILPPHASLMRQPIEEEFRRHRLALPSDYIESVSTMINVGILQHGNAVAFLPSVVAHYYARLGVLAVLPPSIPKLVHPVGIMHMKNQALSPSAMLLIATLKNIYEKG